MKYSFTKIIFLISTLSCFSQNLIPNPSFEQYKRRPAAMLDEGTEFTRAVPGWLSPSRASTDFITSRFRSSKVEVLPPHSGENMIGAVVQGAHWAEYISAKLIEPLEVGKKYYVEFWISAPSQYNKILTGTPYFNDHFGILFDKRLYFTNTKIITKQPQITPPPSAQLQPLEWRKISGTFKATSAATHIYLGQFADETDPEKMLECYYFIDDVFVEKLTKEAEKFEPSKTYKIEGKVASIVMENIYFETDKSTLLPESFTELNKLVKIMNENASMTINIQGHTDSDGNADYNLKLSERRANSVRNYLTEQGISEERLTHQGFGLSKPVAENSSSIGKQKNRRVEFVTKTQDTVSQGVVLSDLSYVFSKNAKNDFSKLLRIGKDYSSIDCENLTSDFDNSDWEMSRGLKQQIQTFNQYQPTDAKKFLLGKTENIKILNIQTSPQHPEFQMLILDILGQLYRSGYTHIGIEHLKKVTQIKSLGYPTLETGNDFQQSIYGEIIRQGNLAGFEFFNLTPSETQVQKALNILTKQKFNFQNQQPKEAAQLWAKAMNVNLILKKNPNANVLLLTDDVDKQKKNGNSTLSFWLKKLANQTMFSVGQTQTFPICQTKPHPLHKRMRIKFPSVFIKRNILLRPIELTENRNEFSPTDVEVFHPKNTFDNNRFTFLSNGVRRPYALNIDKYKMNYPCLVLAYKKGEDVNIAIPIDAIELFDNQDDTKLILPNGKYEVILRDAQKRKKLEIEVR